MANKSMRCANKAAESASARLCTDAEAESAANDVSSVAKASQPVSLMMQALVMKTLVSSQSMSSVSHALLIRMTDPYRRRSKPSHLPSVAWMMLCVVASLDRYRAQLFDSSRIHHLNPSAKNYRAENDFFIDAFFKHRWYSGNHKRDGPLLLQAWNAYIHNLEDVGRDAWNDKLIKARDKYEKRTPTGARYKLYRLSREKGLPCLSWRDPCPCCVNNSARAPKEAYLLTSPWWRVRMSSEMYEGIDNLKSLYDRAGKTFSSGPSAAQNVQRRTARPDPVRQSSVGIGAPKNPRTGDTRATGRDNSSNVRSRRGGSTAAQPYSAGHRESPLMEVEEEGKRSPNYRGEACVSESLFDRVTQRLRGDVEHERYRRLRMAHTVLKHRAEFAFAQLENERALTS
uniref:Uncharacterized protein n=1 Tax=Peronospora matthiolae TaxID=2874970 RepID=A0AAV1VK48_9STRA